MTVKEARELLKTAPMGEGPSKVNPSLTRSQGVDIVRKGIESYAEQYGEDFILTGLYEKRVYQVIRNQRRPRY